MLVVLKNKEIAERWDVFRELIRTSVPVSPTVLPDRLSRALTMALTGHIQCWLLYEEGDNFYGAMITKVEVDSVSGLTTLLIYALGTFFSVKRETREKDFNTLKEVAKALGCPSVSAYSSSLAVINSAKKAAGDSEVSVRHYVQIEV